jgi:hypothetical protein
MDTIAECCTDAVAFLYRSIDRLVLNAYIPTLQTPAAMAVFFREVQGLSIESKSGAGNGIIDGQNYGSHS